MAEEEQQQEVQQEEQPLLIGRRCFVSNLAWRTSEWQP
jgi:hypothetical protein